MILIYILWNIVYSRSWELYLLIVGPLSGRRHRERRGIGALNRRATLHRQSELLRAYRSTWVSMRQGGRVWVGGYCIFKTLRTLFAYCRSSFWKETPREAGHRCFEPARYASSPVWAIAGISVNLSVHETGRPRVGRWVGLEIHFSLSDRYMFLYMADISDVRPMKDQSQTIWEWATSNLRD